MHYSHKYIYTYIQAYSIYIYTHIYRYIHIYWRRKCQPTPAFLPGESQGQRSLLGCCLWGRTGSDTTEAT